MLLVIARKFNDIYYSMSLPEWSEEKNKQLIIISNGIPKKSFPYQEMFNDVKYIRYDGETIKNILFVISELKRTRIPKSDKLVLSNPVLVTNQYIINRSNPNSTIFIEDGSMNYTSFSPSTSLAKKALQWSLGISETKIFNRIDSTYLFYPEKATFFFGTKKKLKLNKKIFPVNNSLTFIEGKKILVGQPLYNSGFISIDKYNQLVNKTIKQLKIDLYVPHAFSSTEEDIRCEKLMLNEYNMTLEAMAASHSFKIFSYGSTVLYTCKTINPSISSILLSSSEKGMEKIDTHFVKAFCNEILKIE